MAPLRIAAFRRLWIALIIFNFGHLIQVVASSWLILELTGSPFWVSLMVGAPTLPLLILSLPAGAAADLLDRRLVLVAASAVLAASSLGMSALWWFDEVTPGRLVSLGLAIGIGIAFFHPAWQAIVPSLVPTSLIPGAVSLNSATGGVATALGPAVGGVLVATVGPGWSFAVAACGYLVILVTTSTARSVEWNQERASMAVAIATGVRYLRFSSNYLWLMLLGALFGFSSAALRAMLPNLTSDILGGDSSMYGGLLGLFGAGALLGGLTRSQAAHRLGARLVPACITLFGVVGVVAGVSRQFAVTAMALTVAGLLWTWILSTLISTYQLLTPDWVRGRTMSAYVLSVFGFVPIGSVVAGMLGGVIGADGSIVAFSVGVMGIGYLASRMPLPVLEKIEPPVIPDTTDADPNQNAGRLEPVMVVNTWTLGEDEFDDFVEFLAELRRMRLRTGAYQWSAYRSASDLRKISEVFMLHSWEQHLQQHQRLDLPALRLIRHMERYGMEQSVVRDHLVAFDVDHPRKRPAWSDLLFDHEQMHRPHIDADVD